MTKNAQTTTQLHSSHMLVMEEAMATHSGTLAWKIPWTEEPGGLQSMRSLRVRRDWVTSLSLFTFMHWRRKWQPTPAFLPGESQGLGSLVGCPLWGCTVRHDWSNLAAVGEWRRLWKTLLVLRFSRGNSYSSSHCCIKRLCLTLLIVLSSWGLSFILQLTSRQHWWWKSRETKEKHYVLDGISEPQNQSNLEPT